MCLFVGSSKKNEKLQPSEIFSGRTTTNFIDNVVWDLL